MSRVLTPCTGGRRLLRVVSLATALGVASGCSLKTMAVKAVANTLSDTGDVFTRDSDPALVRDAIPFALKLYESLLDSVPKHGPLLVATCSAFTQYGFAFVQTEADVIGEAKHDEAQALRDRALKLYLRGRDYCVRGLEIRFPEIRARLMTDPVRAVARAEKKDVPLLYWTAASWGSAISLGVDRPDLVIDLPVVRALAERALALDETWSDAAIHEMMITLDSLPEMIGGSPERARGHFNRAVELQQGQSPGPYVALATGVSVGAQNKDEFTRLLNQALAIDPEKRPSTRLVTLITQRRAKALLDQVDLLFVN